MVIITSLGTNGVIRNKGDNSPAVQIANTICNESKNRNITSNEIEAPRGKKAA